MEAQLAISQATLSQVNVGVNEARTQLEELSQQATDRNRELSQTTAELELLRANYDRLLPERQNLEQRINQLTPEISNLEAERQRLLGAMAQMQLEYERQAENLEIQQQSLQLLENELGTLNTEIETARNTNSTLDRQRQEINAQLERLTSQRDNFSESVTNLRDEIDSLESQRQALSHVQAELTSRQAELERVTARVNELQTTAQELSHQQVELEFLRTTYDRLFNQQQHLEQRINQLTPEISNLEAERQRILQAIAENQQEYHRIEELRQRLRTLQSQIRDEESEQRNLETNIQRLQGIHASLEENNAQLQEENRQLRQERENLENSIEEVLRPLREPLWSQLPNPRRSITDERLFIDNVTNYIQSQGLFFPQRAIQAFHTSLKVQDISPLVILAGISGTGKSELPQRYANYIGAQLLTLAVQPRWDSPQDLQGFYNYVEKKFKPTDLMRGLYQYNHDNAMNDWIAIVLLDEMNLARVEYYFSDFLSKLESRRSHPTYLEIDVGSLPVRDEIRRLKIPKQFLFVGTMNEDETTQSLSDKVLDRANIITFGKPQTLRLRQASQNGSAIPTGYLAYSDFQQWRNPNPDSSLVTSITELLDGANAVMESLGHPFAHRVYQAITQYVVNYPGVTDKNSEAFRFAIADGFGQKLLPKLRGVMVDEAREELDSLERIIDNIGDTPLSRAFSKARAGRYGQFQWQGLVYDENLS